MSDRGNDTIEVLLERAKTLKSHLNEIAFLVYGDSRAYTLADLVARVRMLVREARR